MADLLGSSIEHFVVLMLENRAFDHMVGFLQPKSATFNGLDGSESNPDAAGAAVKVFKITSAMPNHDFYPLANPDEGYAATNDQLFGMSAPPNPPVATNDGFVRSFEAWLTHSPFKSENLQGAAASTIMGMFTPDLLPVLSALAKGYAICDGWFASVPTQTVPNRTFALAGTSLGCVANKEYRNLSPKIQHSIFGALSNANVAWKIYTASGAPHCFTALNFEDTIPASVQKQHIGSFAAFQNDAKAGTLPAFAFIEPNFGSFNQTTPAGIEKNREVQDDQHPVGSLANGEKLIYDVYEALRSGPEWNKTLLLVTYDEHGGNYDHVSPPLGATPPDGVVGSSGFDFKRFGVRVPAVLVSPLIAPGTVLNIPQGGTPFDHTSILATIRACFGVGPLTQRDKAAPDVGAVITLTAARTDNPLAGVQPLPYQPPTGAGAENVGVAPSWLLKDYAHAVAALPVPGAPIADPEGEVAKLNTASDHLAFIHKRLDQYYGQQ